MNIRPARGYFGSGQATIPGRLVLDGVDLMRGAFVRMDDYSLDAVARNVLGEGKALAGSAHDRVGEILRNYAGDLEAFARYARTDARLALEIVERLGLVNLAVARSRLTGMPPDRVAASIASFDFLYLAELHRRRIVAPSVSSSDSRVHAAQAGGHVLEPVTGLHEGVWVFDFKSLYPIVIRTYNIDPLGYLGAGEEAEDPIEIAGGARFRRAPGILPGLLDDLFPRREQAKRDGDGVASQAIKILMNSFYGVLGTPACRFYNPAIANAITGQGRRLLLWSKRWFENKGFQVLYGDTDSLFVASGGDARDGTGGASGREAGCITGAGKEGATSRETKCATDRETESATGGGTDGATDCETGGATNRETEGAMGRGTVGATGTATERGSLLARALTADLAEHIRRESRVESRLELQLEKFYRKLFLPVTRGGTGGARKRYAGQIQGRDDVEFTGMEVVRRDWTELAKEVQRELYGRLFRDEPIEHWLCDLVARLRAGALDEWLVYRKGLRKRVEDYTAQTPPHVAAARKSKSAPGRVIAYLITLAGPEPLDNLTAEPDREHYVAKQVKPVAEPVLATLGLNFERVIGDDRQMGLF